VTTSKPLEEQYFGWLYSKVRGSRDDGPGMSYMTVCSRMHQTAFNWDVPNDDNRAADGKDLRHKFLNDATIRDAVDADREWLSLDASVFEVLASLCFRANFMIDIPVDEFFEMMLINLGLTKYSDGLIDNAAISQINRIIRRFNERRYTSTGKGGIFPLKHADKDQRQVELWYQMSAYMTENKMY